MCVLFCFLCDCLTRGLCHCFWGYSDTGPHCCPPSVTAGGWGHMAAQPHPDTSPPVAYLTVTAAEPFPGLDWCPSSILSLEQLAVSTKLAFLTVVVTVCRGYWERAWRRCFLEESGLIAKISTYICCSKHVQINMWNARFAVTAEHPSSLLNESVNLLDCDDIPYGPSSFS